MTEISDRIWLLRYYIIENGQDTEALDYVFPTSEQADEWIHTLEANWRHVPGIETYYTLTPYNKGD